MVSSSENSPPGSPAVAMNCPSGEKASPFLASSMCLIKPPSATRHISRPCPPMAATTCPSGENLTAEYPPAFMERILDPSAVLHKLIDPVLYPEEAVVAMSNPSGEKATELGSSPALAPPLEVIVRIKV